MKELEIINQNKDLIEKLIEDAKKTLAFSESPKLVFIIDKNNATDPFGKTGYYDPEAKKIAVYIVGRHVKDIMRSISHECVHHAQNLRGDLKKLKNIEPGYAQNDEFARELEREAYEKGNLLFRDYEDGLKYGNSNN